MRKLKGAGILLAAVAGGSVLLASGGHAQTTEPANADQPVIPDSEFEAQLPPLDPELSAPLEPIEDFDVRQEAVPVEPAEPGAPDETIPDAPLPDDPALSEPLAPLATFDVAVPEANPEDDGEDEAPSIRYTLVIEGLEEVGLQGRFRDLSALEDADGRATNGAMVAARAEEDELLAVRLLRSEGFYDGTAVSSIEQVPDQPGQLRVTLTAAPGARYNFGEIAVTGPQTEPPGLAREALPLESGKPIIAEMVEGAEANVRLRLPQQGYPFAEIGLRDILLDPETHLGDYSLPVEPGIRARFGGFTTEGDLAFDAEHVAVLSRFERGDLYDSRMVDDLREAMIATNLFSTVSAEPVATGEKAEDGTEYVNILVRQQAGPARSITGSAGYSTGEGIRLEAAWEHRNLFPPEGSLRFAAIAGTQEQAVRATFRRMNAGKRDRTVLLQVEAGRRDFAAFEGYTARINGLISRESTPIWQKRWTWAYGAELIATNESQIGRPRLSLSDAFFLAGVTGQIGYDASDSLLDPTKGFRLLGRVNPEVSLREPTQPYIRNIVEGSAYFPAGDSLVIAGRARFGSIYGAELSELAPSRRFYAGGGGSVRGFGFQELGPKDAEGRPLGGRSLAEFALEGRYRFGNYGVVGFVDAGQVYDSQFPTFSSMRFGVGIGGRLYTNFGPLRVDVATPIGRRKGESRVAVYISIGQAF
ncbi:autotransporter assembly complex protein TamA [Sphingosinicella rhizophila]|uniref:BamA/TamA family outer membrane protein n=1 Tax=Sphingosinicella rhizophila TaxID=3050082 RepID=A0ABU3Q8G6_9SPHN|nr:BamA/TamA family outer membrane protein [Sphingosinicella sp. GR2756]MDT9599705.1 BamA/TamA family outer membrane protein [Sphingosinicella sp. GR2756]